MEYFAHVAEENTLRTDAGEVQREALFELQLIDWVRVVISRGKR
jgi:hypothetical protein